MRYIGKDTTALLNSKPSNTGEYIQDRDWKFDVSKAEALLKEHSKELHSFNASDYAKKLTGHSLMLNMVMLGYSYEKALLPIREYSMMQAIEANGIMVDVNKKAWTIGRHLATTEGRGTIERELSRKFNIIKETKYSGMYHRVDLLKEYQNDEYAQQYFDLVTQANVRDTLLNKTEFSETVMRNLYKLMAYKLSLIHI